MLELKHLRTLQALADTGSVSAAAEQLHLTQSALSHQITQLENQLGSKLFVRKSNPLRFTPAGQLLLNTAKEVLPRIQQCETTLRALASGEQGRLHIGVECHTCFEWLMPVVRDFQHAWPGVDIDIIPSLTQSGLELLQQGKCDLVITSDPQSSTQLVYEALFRYEQVLVLPINHPLSQLEHIPPEALAEETLICYPVKESRLDVFRYFLNPAGVRPKQLRFSELTLMMLSLVDSSRGVCVLPRWLLDTLDEFRHLPKRRLGETGLWSRLYAALPKTQQHTPAVQDFLSRIQAVQGAQMGKNAL